MLYNMTNTADNIIQQLNTTVSDKVYTDLLDAGLDSNDAQRAAHAPMELNEHDGVVALDPIFLDSDLSSIQWDKLQF